MGEWAADVQDVDKKIDGAGVGDAASLPSN